MKEKNLALEMLKKLIERKIKSVARKNLIISEKFSERLEKIIKSYQNKAINNFDTIEELIKMAKEMVEAENSGKKLGLSDDEMAFYSALTKDEKIKELMKDEILIKIVKELAKTMKNSMTIDWRRKESVQANMRREIKRLLRDNDYPPKDAEDATEKALEQAKLFNDQRMDY